MLQKSEILKSSLPKLSLKFLEMKYVKVIEANLNKGNKNWTTVAKELNISRRTLLEYRQRPEIKNKIRDITFSLIDTEIPDIINSITSKAKKGDVNAAKFLFDLVKVNELYDQKWIEYFKRVELTFKVYNEELERWMPEKRALVMTEIQNHLLQVNDNQK